MTATSAMSSFQDLPRAIRWLVCAVGFVALFYAWDTTLGAVARDWAGKADDIEAGVRTVAHGDALTRELRQQRDTIIGLGSVIEPRRESDGRGRLTNAVVAVLRDGDHSATDVSFDLSGGTDRLREDLSRTIARAGHRISRLTGTLKFEASPADAIAIMADLERHEEVEAIRKVSLLKASNGKVAVNLILEAWVEVPSRKRRR